MKVEEEVVKVAIVALVNESFIEKRGFALNITLVRVVKLVVALSNYF